jgi:putative copper resistance protein D
MHALANMFDTLLENLLFITYACTMGGLVWSLRILKPWKHHMLAEGGLASQSLALMRWGALGMAAVQLAKLMTHAWLLAEAFQRWPFPDYVYTLQCQAGLSRALLAAGLGMVGLWLERRPGAMRPWILAGGTASLLAANAAWVSHAVGRSEARAMLMTLTTIHQLAVAIWLGGIIQLGLLWRFVRQQPQLRPLWPGLPKSFAWIGGPAVLGVVATGIPLAWGYIGTWQGLIGTDYGAMVLIKVALLAAALCFAALNFRIARQRLASGAAGGAFQRVPYYVEAETLLLIATLAAAVSLATQPPAIDMEDQRATWAELSEVFRPKVPLLLAPADVEAVVPPAGGGLTSSEISAAAETRWSDYTHNVSGLFLVLMALAAMASRVRWGGWARYWPLGFVALGIFILVHSDARSSWPFGEIGFWEGLFASDEILLHRLGAMLACGVGLIEWQARFGHKGDSRLSYVIPVLVAMGGLLLLGHVHEGLQPKEEFLIQITHNVIGLLAVIMACSRWLELRLTPPAGRLAGMISLSALLLIGLVLLFYRETPVG